MTEPWNLTEPQRRQFREAHAAHAAMPADPAPSDVMYDDMARAWRNQDYPLAWSLADALLQYEACGGPDGNGGEPLTGPDRDMTYVHAIHTHYAPIPPTCLECSSTESQPEDHPYPCGNYIPPSD